MQIEFDPGKDASNSAEHGVSLALAAQLDWEQALIWMDARADDGEMRMIAWAPLSDRLYVVACVDRDSVRRIISLRKANRHEANHFVNSL